MKPSEIYNLALNPFTRIAGWQAFALGSIILFVTGIVGTYANVYFDGAIDIHFTENANFKTSLYYLGIDILSLVLTLSVAGVFVAKNFRVIDILGTVSLAKAPFLLIALVALTAQAPNLDEIMRDPTAIFSSISFVFVMVFSVPILIWHIILLFNAFKISTGGKGKKVVPVFIISLLFAEIISKLLIAYLF